MYGQYYVSSETRMGVLLIAIKMSSESSSKTTEFANKISLGLDHVGKVENAVSLRESATAQKIQCSFKTTCFGFTGLTPAPGLHGFTDIPAVLDWFRQPRNLVGLPVLTLLRHYSVIDHQAIRVGLGSRSYETQIPVTEFRNDVEALYRRAHDPIVPLPRRDHDLRILTVSRFGQFTISCD